MTDDGVTYAVSWRCWDCGVESPCLPFGRRGPHECRSEDVGKWQSYLSGWENGYRFGIENINEPLVQADLTEFGTGWAGHMRVGDH